ncbi:MAG: TIR domain-containing protein [Ktedonobacterales bacterium]
MSEPRIFVSYSHQDFAQQLVNDLRTAGAAVWYDVSGVGHGDFIDRIDEDTATEILDISAYLLTWHPSNCCCAGWHCHCFLA